jgi:hypothetical protein
MVPRTGAEEENQGKAEETRSRTEARQKVCAEHHGKAEEPRRSTRCG